MLLVLPKQDDVRKYGFFFDDTQEITFNSVGELRDLVRNSRASVSAANGNSLSSHPVMGLAAYSNQARVYYSKLTLTGIEPDFRTDQSFCDTMLVTGVNIPTGRKGTPLSLIDNFNLNQPFNSSNSTFELMPFCLIPTQIGSVAAPSAEQVSFPDLTTVVSSANRQTGDSYQHRRRVYSLTGAMTYISTVASWSYNYTGTLLCNWGSSHVGAMAFSLDRNLTRVYGGGYWRATIPARRNAYDNGRVVPCSAAFGTSALAEGNITLDKFAVFVYEGNSIRAVVFTDQDFESKSVTVGAQVSVDLPEMPVLYPTASFHI